MDFRTRPGTWADLEELCEVEHSSTPTYANYMRDASKFFFDECPGEMVMALNDEDKAVGMGRFTTLPDGSGWLEILRVRSDWQRQGVGRSIYKRYMQLAQETDAPHVAMFTGRTNVASKGLAEENGFKLAGVYWNKELAVPADIGEPDPAFEEITDLEKAKELLRPTAEQWGPHVSFNRTFFRHSDEFYKWLVDNHMVYSNGKDLAVLGARMLHERGLNLGLVSGDVKKAVEFAVKQSAKLGAKKLTCLCPPEREDVLEALKENGFTDQGELIVMEWKKGTPMHRTEETEKPEEKTEEKLEEKKI